MKVLYFYQYFTTPKGSYSTRVYEFSRRWVKAGDSVTVVTTVYDKSDLVPAKFISRMFLEGIELRILNIRVSNRHGIACRLLTFLAYAIFSCWYALALEADVVVCSSPPITVALPGLVARWLRRKRLLFEVRDVWPEVLIEMGVIRSRLLVQAGRAFERLCYRSAHKVIALSEGIAEWIRRTYGFQHVEVVSNASDNQMVEYLRNQAGLPAWAEDKSLVLYTGTIGYANQCGQILEMAAILRERGAADKLAVVLIGDGKERASLSQEAKDRRLDCIHFLGQISKEDVLRWLCAASCALLVLRNAPVLASGSPNKMFDAFAAGVPIVHNTRGWIKDFVDREQCGLSVLPENAEALAEAVMAVTQDPLLRRKLAANARRVARELFDRDLLAGRMHQILRASAGVS